MNEFQSTQSGAPLLKEYGETPDQGAPRSPLAEALRRRRRRLTETRMGDVLNPETEILQDLDPEEMMPR